MTWKQPIPTNLEQVFGDDYQCNLLYRELIYRSCNSDTTIKLGKKYIGIKRGQVMFGRNKYGLYLDWSPSKVERVFQRLCKKSDMFSDIIRDKNYTVVTFNNYDELIKMDMCSDNNRTSSGHEPDTSKSDKSVKNKKRKLKKKKILDQKLDDKNKILAAYNQEVNGNYKLTDGISSDLDYWLSQYSCDDILLAVSRMSDHDFWKLPKNQSLIFFLKRKNKTGNQDAIGELLALKPERAGVDLMFFNPMQKIKS